MSEYLVAPMEEPDWVVSAEELAAALRERWPLARVGLGAVEGSSMLLEALIPLQPAPRELGVALSGTGQAVTLEPADLEAAAEFAVWFAGTLLPGRGIHLIEPGSMRSVEIVAGVSADEVRAGLT
ncbi:hypothetical protein FB561_6970 [Kribbella amoyensis]|uniref:Uncharacterized protein n=1 Tax=Kribbella amoyensis TaxID=996641 RepID=A0A561B2J3_9ACTN|nr:hypothetical protein [Kribbella amoyensis]TWD73085.1 hypothetical protein FB561_6970 [Kribbella amoyensis]